MNTNKNCGLIILGNSRVGKSSLANILLNCEAFIHEFSSSSVTHAPEYQEITVGHLRLTIFNIPGLIEAEQSRFEEDMRKYEVQLQDLRGLAKYAQHNYEKT